MVGGGEGGDILFLCSQISLDVTQHLRSLLAPNQII